MVGLANVMDLSDREIFGWLINSIMTMALVIRCI